jgi:hypothetical protein
MLDWSRLAARCGMLVHMPLTPESLAEMSGRLSVSPATVRRYLRVAVTLPDGRQIQGQAPGVAVATLPEHELRDRLARQLRGITEAVLPYGRADVLTKSAVFEVETYRGWRNGARQVLAYSSQCGLPPALALFGRIHRDDLVKLYVKLRDGRPPVQLWWWTGGSWTAITSRRACCNMPAWPAPR